MFRTIITPIERTLSICSKTSTKSLPKSPPKSPVLPLELIATIIFEASTSLVELAHLSSISKAIRAFIWTSPKVKARVLIKNSRRNRITHSFFAFFALPDSASILGWLIDFKYITPESCPRLMALTQPLHNRPEIMQKMLDGGFPPESSTLLVAANRGYVDMFAQLVSQGLSPGPFVLTAAAAMGHDEIVQMLLERNMVPDPLAINTCAGAGHISTLRILLTNIHVQRMEKTRISMGLRDAARSGYREVVEALLEFGVKNGFALSEAIAAGCTEVVGALLAAGCQPSMADWMAARRNPALRKTLMEHARRRRKAKLHEILQRVFSVR